MSIARSSSVEGLVSRVGAAGIVLGATAMAQSLTVTHTYPRCASYAVASEPEGVHSSHSTVPLMFAGTGGQLSVLNVSGQNVGLWSGAESDIYVGGVVRDGLGFAEPLGLDP